MTVELGPRPFLKWAGGKRQLLPEIARLLPRRWGTYHEPFLGGGALFFHLHPGPATLNDANARLVRAYVGIRDQVEAVVTLLERHEAEHDPHFFERMRGVDVDGLQPAEAAAWLIYLNRTAFNGLYRVNSAGRFNVPLGRHRDVAICRPEVLRACSAHLRHAELLCQDFAGVLDRARPGDLVYFDPPYVPLSSTSSFTSYTAERFGPADQQRLRDVALELKRRGVHVLLSNSATPEVEALYGSPEFEVVRREVRRSISARSEGRGTVAEVLIR